MPQNPSQDQISRGRDLRMLQGQQQNALLLTERLSRLQAQNESDWAVWDKNREYLDTLAQDKRRQENALARIRESQALQTAGQLVVDTQKRARDEVEEAAKRELKKKEGEAFAERTRGITGPWKLGDARNLRELQTLGGLYKDMQVIDKTKTAEEQRASLRKVVDARLSPDEKSAYGVLFDAAKTPKEIAEAWKLVHEDRQNKEQAAAVSGALGTPANLPASTQVVVAAQQRLQEQQGFPTREKYGGDLVRLWATGKAKKLKDETFLDWYQRQMAVYDQAAAQQPRQPAAAPSATPPRQAAPAGPETEGAAPEEEGARTPAWELMGVARDANDPRQDEAIRQLDERAVPWEPKPRGAWRVATDADIERAMDELGDDAIGPAIEAWLNRRGIRMKKGK